MCVIVAPHQDAEGRRTAASSLVRVPIVDRMGSTDRPARHNRCVLDRLKIEGISSGSSPTNRPAWSSPRWLRERRTAASGIAHVLAIGGRWEPRPASTLRSVCSYPFEAYAIRLVLPALEGWMGNRGVSAALAGVCRRPLVRVARAGHLRPRGRPALDRYMIGLHSVYRQRGRGTEQPRLRRRERGSEPAEPEIRAVRSGR